MKTERNYGLDLFRMFSMFCVIILHLLGHGGALTTTTSRINHATVWLWEALATPAVNCFVLLSGYVGYRKSKIYPKISNLITIVLSTLFYSLVAVFVYKFAFSKAVGLKQLVFSALPVMTKQYWFVTAYVGMFLFSPIIHLFVDKADRKALTVATVITLALATYSLLENPFGLSNGYSTIWFILLYMVGAMVRKEELLDRISIPKAFLLIAAGLGITLGAKLVCALLGSPFSSLENLLISYCSPTTLLMALGWMVVFSKIQTAPTANKIISFLTPSVFSVYLIHDNPYIRELFITDRFGFINGFNPVVTTGILFATAFAIFVGCLLIDQIRALLFRILRIPQITQFLERKIKAIFRLLFRRIPV